MAQGIEGTNLAFALFEDGGQFRTDALSGKTYFFRFRSRRTRLSMTISLKFPVPSCQGQSGCWSISWTMAYSPFPPSGS